MTAKRQSRWGVGVVVVFALFVAVMLGITGFLMTQDANLVTDSYYEKELRYQERIQAMERTRALGALAGVEKTGDMIVVRFPRTVPQPDIGGRITLYRPADRSADRVVHIAPDSLWEQHIITASLAAGLWRCQVQWTMRQEEYYLEQPFMVP